MSDDRIRKLEEQVALLYRIVAMLSHHEHDRWKVVVEVDDAQFVPRLRTADDALRHVLVAALEETGRNKTSAAKVLGVNVKTLHSWCKKFGVSV